MTYLCLLLWLLLATATSSSDGVSVIRCCQNTGADCRPLYPVDWIITMRCCMFGVSEGLMRRLQSVQSAAARLVTVAAPRPHYADPTIAPLAARASESHFQDRRPDLSVSDRPGTGVSGRRLSAYFRRQYAPTPSDRHSDLRRPAFKQQLRRPVFCGCRTTSVEHVASTATAL